jgi:hypothetical protein
VRPVESAEAAREAARSVTEALEGTLARAARRTEEERHRNVDGEWSTVQSLRHLVLVVDLWSSKVILGQEDPFHPMALPPTFMGPTLPGTSIDPAADPTFDEAATVLRDRLAHLGASLATLTDEDLDREVGTHARTVGGALGVLFTELRAHEGFIRRDLAVIEREAAGPGAAGPPVA